MKRENNMKQHPPLNQPIPFIDLAAQQARIRPLLDQALGRVLDHGQYILGPECFYFEQKLREYTHVPHILGCSNGTDALTMVLMALDVGPGDVVLVPSFTFIATAEVVGLRGALPVFVDVDPVTFNMCPRHLLETIQMVQKKGLSLKGIISVDLFGHPAPHAEIEKIAEKHGLWVMVDAAQSLGAMYHHQHTVMHGIAATTSFFPAKPLGGYGDGGAIFTKDEALAKKLREIRVHGQGAVPYEATGLGLTGRLDTLQAAILLEKIKLFPEEVENRNRAAKRYSEKLSAVCRVPQVKNDCVSVWAQYTLQTDRRDELQAFLKERGVPSVVYYKKPLDQQPVYQPGCIGQSLAQTDRLAQEVLSLPMHGYLKPDVQDYIIDSVLAFFER
jgi:dTDP-4-amino-4,6-dideoxygalactose transaminase